MKKLFISQPMRGKTEQEILRVRKRAIEYAVQHVEGEPIEVLDSYFTGYDGKNPLFYLARSIELLSEADMVYFAPGWKDARGCRIENACAREYGLYVIEDNGKNEAVYIPEECPLP